ncbi:transposase domain-containing protein [Kitasatospora griseola]
MESSRHGGLQVSASLCMTRLVAVSRAVSAAGGRRLDRGVIGAPTRVFRPGPVDRPIAETGRGEKPDRLLPARVVAYFVLAVRRFFGAAPSRSCARSVRGAPGGRAPARGPAPRPVRRVRPASQPAAVGLVRRGVAGVAGGSSAAQVAFPNMVM